MSTWILNYLLNRYRAVKTVVNVEFRLEKGILEEDTEHGGLTWLSSGSSGYPFWSSSSRIPDATKAMPQRKQPVTILWRGVLRIPNFPAVRN